MYSVREAARETGIRVLGPNTIGLMVPARSLNATYAHMGAIPGKVAFVGQSGTIASSVIDWAFARGVGFSYFLTLGDGMDIDHDDLIDYLAQDTQTRAILLHIENIPNPRRFMSAVRGRLAYQAGDRSEIRSGAGVRVVSPPASGRAVSQ